MSTNEGNTNGDGEETSRHVSESMASSNNLTSEVHNFFERKEVNGIIKAVCKACARVFSGNTVNGTSSLKKHIQKTCPNRKIHDLKQMLLAKQSGASNVVGNFSFDSQLSRGLLLKAIIVHEYPLSMVDHFRFRTFINSLQPSFKIPSRATIRRDALGLYSEFKRKLMGEIDKIESRISLTTDMWTASHQKKGYIAITAHYIDNYWHLQKRLLRFCYVPSPHTAENITEYLMKCIDDWKLEHKVCTLTVDNCTTNDAIIELLLGKLRRGALMLDGILMHMRCAAHILNLIVQDGLDVIGVGIEQVRKSVAFWSGTPKRIEKFEAATNFLQVTITKKLTLDCKTRWNSTYVMLETALLYKEVFKHLFKREKNYDCLPSENEWEVTEKICKKLKLFYDATELLSGTRYPTVNYFFKEMCKIKLAVADWTMCGDEMIEVMAIKMQQKLEKYWNIVYGVVGVAALLDPRFKKCLLEFYLNRIYPNAQEAQTMVDTILNMAEKLEKEYTLKFGMPTSYVTETSSSYAFNDTEDDMYNEFASTKRRKIENVTSELSIFLEDGLEPMGRGTFDILVWWRDVGRKYPTLQAIAKDIYAIPASTVASESTFSLGGRIITPHRSRLNPMLVESLACCQSWIQEEDTILQIQESTSVIRNVFEDVEEDNDFGEATDATLHIIELD